MGYFISNRFSSRTARTILLSMILVFVALRAYLTFFPSTNLDIGPYNVHHLFTGVLLLIACSLPLILRSPNGTVRWILATGVGAGLGLVLDEWVYLIVTDGSDSAYLLDKSLWGAVFFIAVTAIYIVILAWQKK